MGILYSNTQTKLDDSKMEDTSTTLNISTNSPSNFANGHTPNNREAHASKNVWDG